MTGDLIRPVVYDSGALIAADRNDRRFHLLHARALASGRPAVVPTPVLTQVWRDGAKQARVSTVLRGCALEPVEERLAKQAGVLLGRAGTADAVDAIVVATALAWRAVVVTSDPADMQQLIDAARSQARPAVITL